MFSKSVFVFLALLASQSLAFSLRGLNIQRKAPALPELHCVKELAACKADQQCGQCFDEATKLDNPNLLVGSTCDDLLAWWYAIGFNDDKNCYFEFGFSVLAEYLYCLFDTYKYSAKIDVCETGPTMAPSMTMAPTMSPTMIDVMSSGSESSTSATGPEGSTSSSKTP